MGASCQPKTMSPLAFLCILISFSTPFISGDDTLTAYEVLEEYGFPVGLLPQGVTDYEIDNSTGEFSVYLNGSCTFSIDSYKLKYASTITGVIATDKITSLSGIKVKILFVWLSIVEVVVDGNELEFSVGIASAEFSIDNFVESPQCGCGFDCVGGNVKTDKSKSSVYSS